MKSILGGLEADILPIYTSRDYGFGGTAASVMTTEGYGRRWFLRQMFFVISGLLVAKGIWASVWLGHRPILPVPHRGSGSAKQTSADMRSFPFSDSEHTILEVLVDIIFPDDGNGPSAKEIKLTAALRTSLIASSQRVLFYRTGLANIERLSWNFYAKCFTDLPKDEQHRLLSYLDQVTASIAQEAVAMTDKIIRKLRYWYYTWQGTLAAADFWLQLQRDSFAIYYSHDLTWKWLGYSGPPFPNGYISDLRI
jgi:hypothetical protein